MSARLTFRTRGIAALCIALLVIGAVIALVVRHGSPERGDIADDATLSVSSRAPGSIVRDVTDSRDTGDIHRGWRTDNQTVGAWIQFSWSLLHELRRIAIERNPLSEPGATAGYLVFGDGSQLQVRLSATSATTVVPFTPRSVQTLRFVISAASPDAKSITLSRVRIYNTSHSGDVVTADADDGDAAPVAAISATGGAEIHLNQLNDGRSTTAMTDATPIGSVITLHWARPRELKTVSIAGAASPASLASATLTFSDGSQLEVGAVGSQADHPTTISFMPRVTSWLRLTIDTVSGSGALALAEIVADQLDAPPRVPAGTSSVASAATACPTSSTAPSAGVGIVAECPVDGASVSDSVTLALSVAAQYTDVQTQVVPSDSAAALPLPIESTPTAGALSVPLDLTALPAGPFAVQLTASGAGGPSTTVTVHLNKQTGAAIPVPSAQDPPSGPAKGRSLVFDDEFERQPDISAAGHDADYASAKPGVTGVQDFGDAIFAPPSARLGNVSIVDHSYLKLAVQPRPADYPDPAGDGRNYVGAMLASAGAGGTGFSAQYGYFEARMLAPAASGTWPAFWMLPSTNLISAQSVVAEIDAVELYGTVPKGSCSTTHEYENGHDGGVAHCGNRWSSTRQAGWHTYGVSIEPTGVRFYIDGKLIATAPQVKGGAEPMFFMLDLALGGGWPVKLASNRGFASLFIDYIRVYV